MKYAALISYVGKGFCGWQKQTKPDSGEKPSIQRTIEEALLRISGEAVSVVASGRTDAGVHAAGQVIHFSLRRKEWDPAILKRALNALLPVGRIQVLSVKVMPDSFHAQMSAARKQYSYYFQQGPSAYPPLERYSWWIRKPLDLEAMNRSVQVLIGEHDYVPFQASGAAVKTTVRRILEAEVTREPLGPPFFGLNESDMEIELSLVRVRLVGTGFLKQMVRGIAGTLLQVGECRRPPECMGEILASRDRSLVGPTAPARGLWLEKVWYEGLRFDSV